MQGESIQPSALPGAWRATWRALWTSRLIAWGAGVVALLAAGRADGWERFDPAGLTAPFGAGGDLLAGPLARWDAVWFLSIADGGYGDGGARTAFFPLYPLLARAAGAPLGSSLAGGALVSLAALAVALVLLHRLATLEIGREHAGLAVALVALFPASFFLSAVYSESLFLALSVGAVYAARTGRWRWAGTLGALGAATRSTGVLVVVPLALLWLVGPGPGPGRRRTRLGADALWILLVPLGLAAYVGYLALATGEPLAPFRAQEVWFRRFAGPLGGAWDGTVAAWQGARQLISGSREPVYFTAAGGDPFEVAGLNLMLFGFLVAAVPATLGALRRLPLAYGAYAVAALAVPLSWPVAPQPLMSLPRFLAVLFPLHLWLALWAGERRLGKPVLAAFAVLLAIGSARFARWQWVA